MSGKPQLKCPRCELPWQVEAAGLSYTESAHCEKDRDVKDVKALHVCCTVQKVAWEC